MQYIHLDIKNLYEAILYAFEYTETTFTTPTSLSPSQPLFYHPNPALHVPCDTPEHSLKDEVCRGETAYQ